MQGFIECCLATRTDDTDGHVRYAETSAASCRSGYVGWEGGQLSEKVRRNRTASCSLTQVKGSPECSTSCRLWRTAFLPTAAAVKTIVVMTSNVGAQSIVGHKALGFTADSAASDASYTKRIVFDELKKTFRPEFLNRVDDIIVFDRLSEDDIKKISVNMLESVASRLSEMSISLKWNDEVLTELRASDTTRHTARALRRAIRSAVEDVLSGSCSTERSKAKRRNIGSGRKNRRRKSVICRHIAARSAAICHI